MLNSEQKKTMLSNLIIMLLAGMGFGLFLINWANTPVVYFSFPKNTCVEVISPNPDHNCENIPEKYQHEWVKS